MYKVIRSFAGAGVLALAAAACNGQPADDPGTAPGTAPAPAYEPAPLPPPPPPTTTDTLMRDTLGQPIQPGQPGAPGAPGTGTGPGGY
jgi:hypothetical protein